MPNTYNSNTLLQTYRDDWNEDSAFHKILFNAGRALQARELNQLQTIIQAELTRFGRNIFKEGSAVDAGLMEMDNNYRYVEATGVDIDLLASGSDLIETGTGVSARVIQNVSLGANTARLYIRYTSGGSQTPGTNEITFSTFGAQQGGQFVSGGNTFNVSSTGAGVRIIVDSGNFFAAGRFVHAPKQELILSETTRVYNGTIGFKLIQDVYTVNDSQTLYDNTGDLPNVASPGADRWRIRLVLTDKANIASDDSFIFLCRIVNSKIVEQVDELDSYNIINDMIARRTYEESGNYIAEPFQLTFEDDNSADSDIFAIVGPGLAYVRGYRVENDYPKRLRMKRPQATDTVQTDFIAVDYGAYVLVNNATATSFPSNSAGAGEPKVELRDGGSTVGSANVKHVAKHYDPDTGELSTTLVRVYLDNIEMDLLTPGTPIDGLKDFTNVDTIWHSSGTMTLSQSRLFNADKSTNLFATPRPRPQGFSGYEFTFQKTYSGVTAGASTAGGLDVNQGFVDPTQWVVFNASGNFVPNATVTIGTGAGGSFTVTNATGTITVVAYVSGNSVNRRQKSLTTGVSTGLLSANGELSLVTDGTALTVYDVYDLISVVDNSTGAIITDAFYVDGGQRDTHYEQAKIIKKPGANVDVSNSVQATYRWFSWSSDQFDGSGTGYFFDVQSYTNIDYTEIPDYKMNNGTIVSLRDYIDFRGKKNTSYITSAVPKVGEPVQVTAKYYLSRADKLIATEDGDFQILMGQQAENPLFAKTPDNALELYKILMNPNTISPEDINTTFIEHKRYTMADIAKLERKLDAMDEKYTLSLAELEARLDVKYDETTGQPETPTSRQTDDGTDHTRTYPNHPDHCAALDPENHLLRPCYEGDNLRLIYRPNGASIYESSNITISGDNAYVNFSETPWISQPLASQSISINPNSKVDYIGNMELSPSSDEWKSPQVGVHAVPGATRLDKKEALLWNSWQWNWGGRAIEDLHVDESLMTKYGRAGIVKKPRVQSARARRRLGGTGGHVNRVVSSETIRNSNSQNRVVDVAVIPWIRSRKIYFQATGLKPFTKFIPFFDGINVSDWCKSEAFVRWSGRDDDLGNQGQTYSSGHPDGSSELTSNSAGYVSGSFFIPNETPLSNSVPLGVPTLVNNAPLRFKAGVKEFKILDINSPNHNNAGSYAIALYTALGMIDRRKDGMTTTRNPNKIKQIESKIKRPYNASEMKDYLNGISIPELELIAPHISGSWGGDFSGPIVNFAGIDLSTILSDYVNVDENSAAGVSNSAPDQDVSYPFAQSFTIDNQFGVVLTKVDLYFEQVDENIPISVEIRNMVNGKPGNLQVPGSSVTLSNLSAQTDVSVTADVAVTFTFEEPVFLDPGREYALVVKTQSPNYKIWIAKAGEYVVGSTNTTVSTQAANGQLFLPHTGTAGTSKELDLSFVLHRAVFDTNASLVFRNAVLPSKLLGKNPIILTTNSAVAYIKHDCHGLDIGEDVVISGVPAGTYGGINATAINDTHTILDVDAHGFTINLGSNATATGEFGGSEVLSSRNLQFILANPQIETVVPNSTSIDITARFTTGRSLGGSETKFVKMDNYVRIAPDQNYEFNAPHLIAQRSEEVDATHPNGPANTGGFSLDVKIDMKSPNDFVSPIVDLQRASMTLIQNCIDNGYYINPVVESEPYGSSSPAQHHTAPVETQEPSTNLEVKLDAHIPPEANLDVWYRAVMTGQNILDQYWQPLPATSPVVKDADPSVLHRSIYEIKGLPKFTQSQVKLVMNSTNMAKIPQIGLVDIGTFL